MRRPCVTLFENGDVVVRTVLILTAVGQFISGAQVCANRRLFESGGVLDWRLVSRQYEGVRMASMVASRLPFDAPTVMSLAGIKCASAAAAILTALTGASLVIPLVGLVGANAALAVRTPVGWTGADQMGNVVCLATLLAALVDSPRSTSACLVFIALQASSAYIVAGSCKLGHLTWRDGSCLRALLTTGCWSNARMAAWMRDREALSMVVGRLVLGAEILFPLVLIAPADLAAGALLLGVLFHVVLAFVMGLNTFVWMFPATYPAIMFTNILLRAWWLGR